MGSGRWSTHDYMSGMKTRHAAGRPHFGHDHAVRTGKARGVHAALDPRTLKDGPRESRDSAEHPLSLPIAVIFDVTGSMRDIPSILQQKLALLMDVILARANIADPQVLVGAVGDSLCDSFPFQVGQFESDNRFDEQLRNLILEGGGGGQDMESYGLAYRFAAHHTVTDAFEKRGKKGYFVTIGDEKPWPHVTAAEVEAIFGIAGEADEAVEDLIAKARERWELFHIFPTQAAHGGDDSIKGRWRELLGERVIMLNEAELVCETIAGLVHMLETSHDLDKVMDDVGLKGARRAVVKNALVPMAALRLPAHLASGALPSSHGGTAGKFTTL
jgi:hypothetical protein